MMVGTSCLLPNLVYAVIVLMLVVTADVYLTQGGLFGYGFGMESLAEFGVRQPPLEFQLVPKELSAVAQRLWQSSVGNHPSNRLP